MRIAFDLDGTLVPTAGGTERVRPAALRLVFRERLRAGSVQLLRQLAREGHDIWVYTTSLRSVWYVRSWFRLLGVRLGGVVNHRRNQQALRGAAQALRGLSKFPPAFGIDLLVDDSPGVRLEGERHRFAVVLVDPEASTWADAVRAAVAGAMARMRERVAVPSRVPF